MSDEPQPQPDHDPKPMFSDETKARARVYMKHKYGAVETPTNRVYMNRKHDAIEMPPVSAHTYHEQYAKERGAPRGRVIARLVAGRGCLWVLAWGIFSFVLMLIGTWLMFTIGCVLDVWCVRYGSWVLGLL